MDDPGSRTGSRMGRGEKFEERPLRGANPSFPHAKRIGRSSSRKSGLNLGHAGTSCRIPLKSKSA
jgi:hypothetical protein